MLCWAKNHNKITETSLQITCRSHMSLILKYLIGELLKLGDFNAATEAVAGVFFTLRAAAEAI